MVDHHDDLASIQAHLHRFLEDCNLVPMESLAAAGTVLAPRLFVSEVANALWKYVRAGALDEETALERLREARSLITSFADDGELIEEALSVAVRFEHPVSDAVYATLARRNACAVVTSDARLRSLLGEMKLSAV